MYTVICVTFCVIYSTVLLAVSLHLLVAVMSCCLQIPSVCLSSFFKTYHPLTICGHVLVGCIWGHVLLFGFDSITMSIVGDACVCDIGISFETCPVYRKRFYEHKSLISYNNVLQFSDQCCERMCPPFIYSLSYKM